MANQNQGWTDEATSFDWDNISDAMPPPVEDGIYKARFVKAEAKKTKGNDKNPPTPALNLQLEFIAPYGGGELGPVSKTAFSMLIFGQKTVWQAKQCASKLNVNPPKTNSYDDLTSFGRDLLEAGEFYVRTKKEEYQGKWNATIAAYHSEEEAATAASTGATGSGATSTEPVPQRRKRGAAASEQPAAA
jgi:hypothetical protein